jgi:hypothetical protein
LALSVPLSRFTPQVGGGSAFYVRRLRASQTMKTTDTLKAAMDHPFFLLAFIAALYFIPHSMFVVCPAYFAVQLSLFPDRYRSRSGSLTMAFCLFGAISLALAIIAIYSLIQGHWM